MATMTADSRAADEARIRNVVEDWAKALHAKDVAAIMAHAAPDILTFDLAPPLQRRGEAVRESLAAWFPTFKGPIGYEIRDLEVAASGDAAFCHSLNRITGERTDGFGTNVWIRATICLRKHGGAWKVVHEHTSVPFYMDGSLKAAVDLKP